VLAIMAFGLGGVRMPALQWLQLAAIALLGVVPFCALGLMIGAKANANAAPAFVNLIYLPMAFLSGLWMPLAMLPKFIGQIAPVWPAYHLAQLALMAVGQVPAAGIGGHLLWLAGFSFGSWIALRACVELQASALITIAPPVGRDWDFASVQLPTVPWLVIQGDVDEIVDADAVRHWVAGLSKPPQLIEMEGASHFFHRKLMDLRGVVKAGIRGWLPLPPSA